MSCECVIRHSFPPLDSQLNAAGDSYAHPGDAGVQTHGPPSRFRALYWGQTEVWFYVGKKTPKSNAGHPGPNLPSFYLLSKPRCDEIQGVSHNSIPVPHAAAHHTFEQLGGCPMPERHAEHEPTLGHLWAHLCLLLCMKRAPGHLSPRHNQRYCPFLLPSNAVSCHRQVSGPPNSAPSANDFCSIGAFVTFYDKYII